MPKSQRPSSSTHSNTFSPLSRPSRSGTHQQTRSSLTSADEEVEDVASRADEILERLHTTRNGNRQTRQSKLSIRRDKDALKVEAARLKEMAKLFAEKAAKIEEALKGLNDDIPEPDASQGQSIQNSAHHPAQPSDSLTTQNSTQHQAQQSASRNLRQTTRNTPRKTAPTSSSDLASDSGSESEPEYGSEYAPGSTRESSPEPTCQTKRKTVRRTKPQPPTQQAAYSAPRPTTSQPPRPTTRQPARPATHPTRRQPAQQVIPTAGRSSRSSGSSPTYECDLHLWSARSTVSTIGTGVVKNLDYQPESALLHQFNGMDHQTVVIHGKKKLQLWDTADKSLVGELNGSVRCPSFRHVKPVSSSVLAVVSDRSADYSQEDFVGGLSFVTIKWLAHEGRFDIKLSRPWIDRAVPIGRTCVVEGVESSNRDDDNRIPLFTGGLADGRIGGSVYRRLFDINDGVEKTRAQKMDMEHHRSVSAICHVGAGGYVVSGSTGGTIHCNDVSVGTCTGHVDVGDFTTITSIIRCPFSPNLFMVCCSETMSKWQIYDYRDMKVGGKPKLELKLAGNMIARNSSATWNAGTDLIFAPINQSEYGVDSGTVGVWDSRCIKDLLPTQLSLPGNVANTFSVSVTEPMEDGNRAIVTANSKTLSYVPITTDIVNCY